VRRITKGHGADIVIDGIGGDVLSGALGALASEGCVMSLGYSASRQTTIDVTKLIVPQASIRGLNMFTQPRFRSKKPRSNSTHSTASTPSTISALWFNTSESAI